MRWGRICLSFEIRQSDLQAKIVCPIDLGISGRILRESPALFVLSNIFWLKKIFGQKIFFQDFRSKIFWSKNILVQEHFGPKKFWIQKNLRSKSGLTA